MAEQGLPPVGELVRVITTDGDRHGVPQLARWTGVEWQVSRVLPMSSSITSWVRVLVVPDTDETRERLAAAMGGWSLEDWRATVERLPAFAADILGRADSVLAALREAAGR